MKEYIPPFQVREWETVSQTFDPPGELKHDEMKNKYGLESLKWTSYCCCSQK